LLNRGEIETVMPLDDAAALAKARPVEMDGKPPNDFASRSHWPHNPEACWISTVHLVLGTTPWVSHAGKSP
jgi:hypothetical protein